jgi:hypothetical protein
MNPEFKTQWIAALRSGEYTQGHGTLQTHDNEFCCLGVLCDLYAKDGGGEWERRDSPGSNSHIFRMDHNGDDDYGHQSRHYLPSNLREVAGLPDEFGGSGRLVGLYDLEGCEVVLSDLNDSKEFTFDQIADVIDYFL